jgi:hypothetical protein
MEKPRILSILKSCIRKQYMAQAGGARIYEFPAGGRKKPPAFKSPAPKEEGRTDIGMLPEACIMILELIAPMSERTQELLSLPGKMHTVSVSGSTSLSSDPYKSAAPLSGFMLYGSPLPTHLPEYGIHITQSGSNAFAILIDKRRKIIVCESVRSMYADEGSWAAFASSIRTAEGAAAMLQRDELRFEYVAIKDGIMRTV